MITKFGKRFLANFVAGNSSFSSKEMALGIATELEYPLADTNSRLGFEFYRVPIRQGGIDIDSSVDPVKYTVIYSATIPTNIAGKINEIGIYSGQSYSRNLYDSKFISNFELPYQWTPEPDLDQSDYRIGDSSLIFTSDSTSPREYTYDLGSIDISGYNPSDKCVYVIYQGRQMADVLRTIAHELVHQKQDLQGKITGNIPDIGGIIEDTANAIAGRLVKMYVKEYDAREIYSL